jgi:Fe2+ or Zn2+ uptake regulation protein
MFPRRAAAGMRLRYTDHVSDDLHTAAAQKLRRVSQRYTPGRRMLVEALADASCPLTIPEIVERAGTLATSSVYRNLAALEQAGVVTRIVTRGDHARFELSEQFGEHHHHLVCLDCGSVSDFTLPARVEESLEQALGRMARKRGYLTDNHRLDLAGTCPDCQRAG